MAATYTFDVFTSLDGFGSYGPPGDWGGYWGRQGPELLAHREEQYRAPQRMVLGARTYREFVQMLDGPADSEVHDPWVTAMRALPATVVSGTLDEPVDWPDATVVRGDAVDVVRRLKADSPVPLRSHGSLSLNRALLAAGLVDILQITVFPVVTGRSGTEPVLAGVPDLDLDLLGSRTLDGRTLELRYRPRLHHRRPA
ncbi:dihydrofolate reductase family protein [Cellulomonas triticagri]|jgi:dihydrofolate reductase|uniref:Deaminase n=1 Tax=Cellulomonas triticagri TaxID=2483352 RepID=A0A3M2JRG4_9CELL|nr:dihydrofolate reductase family protein [Cellulomonas triticagri]RMI14460.1 deaminase [Cellulomonas triticagri]